MIHARTHIKDFSFHCAGCFRGFSLRVEKNAENQYENKNIFYLLNKRMSP